MMKKEKKTFENWKNLATYYFTGKPTEDKKILSMFFWLRVFFWTCGIVLQVLLSKLIDWIINILQH